MKPSPISNKFFMGNMEEKTPTFLELIEEEIVRKNHDKAFTHIIFYFRGPNHEIEDIKKIYFYLNKLIPHLNPGQMEKLRENAFDGLNVFEKLYNEQMQLAFDLGNWHNKRADSLPTKEKFPEYLQAMHYYAKAIQIAENFNCESREIHFSASSLFMRIIYDELIYSGIFRARLEHALGEADPEKFQKILNEINILKQYRCQARDALIIKEFYQISEKILSEMKPASQKKFGRFVEEIKNGLIETFSPENGIPITQKYKIVFSEFRKNFKKKFEGFSSEINDFEKVKIFQQEITKEFLQMLRENFFNHAFAFLEPAPCSYDFRIMGSTARLEFCPFSDMEWMILIEKEDKECTEYFEKFAQIIELQIVSLGETPATNLPVFSCLHHQHKSGFHVDSGGNPAKADLIQTPIAMANFQKSVDDDFCSPFQSLRKTTGIMTNNSSLFEIYEKKMHENLIGKAQVLALKLLAGRIEEYKRLFKTTLEKQDIINLKEQFVQLIHFSLNDLALYYNISKKNTLDVINALVEKGVFTESSGELLKEIASAIYMTRIRLHFEEEEQKEEASFRGGNLKFKSLLKHEKAYLSYTYWLVLRPFYKILEESKNLKNENLLEKAFYSDIRNEDLYFIQALVRKNKSLEEHKKVYLDFSKEFFLDPLREVYLRTLKSFGKENMIPHLAPIPNPSGFRQSYLIEYKNFQKGLFAITTENPPDSKYAAVSLQSRTLRKPRYLKKNLKYQIIDIAKTNDIKRFKEYRDSFHNIAKVQGEGYDLHIKQNPRNVLMEYAIHNLISRLMGKGTPYLELVRLEIEIEGNKKMYPCLISETIKGETLAKVPDPKLDSEQKTWVLICSILIRPGDGSDRNIIVDEEEKIFLINNEFSFVEPTITGIFGEKIQFTSIIFLLNDEPLNLNVIDEFISLNYKEIVHQWLEDSKEKEKESIDLFSKEERAYLYEKNSNKAFTSSVLLREGTIISLCMQFEELQNFLRKKRESNSEIYPRDLLRAIITLQRSDFRKNPIGDVIFNAYERGFNSETIPQKRLENALSCSLDQSKSTSHIMKTTLGKFPTIEEIEEEKIFSLETALEELFFIEIYRNNDHIKIDKNEDGKTILHANFAFAKDKVDLQNTLLQGLEIYISRDPKNKPEKIIFEHCSVLDSNKLITFLHKNLKCLILKDCHVCNKIFVEISKRCPLVNQLFLEKCSQITAIEDSGYFFTGPIIFSKLEIFHIVACKNLLSLIFKAPYLKKLEVVKNKKLKLKNKWFDVPLTTKVIFQDCPLITSDELNEKIIKPFYLEVKANEPLIFALMEFLYSTINMLKTKRRCIGYHFFIYLEGFFSINYIDIPSDFDMSKININDKQAALIGQLLGMNQHIRTLDLSQNNITNLGVSHIAQALTINSTLTSLNLSENKISDEGAILLADALKMNSSIKELHLSSNPINEKGKKALRTAFKMHPNVKFFL